MKQSKLVDCRRIRKLSRNGLLGTEKKRLCEFVGNPEGIILKLALSRVTTRNVLRGKNPVKLCLVTVKTTRRAIANAVALNYESFTRRSHAHLDNNSFHRVALIFVDVLLQHN
jgi:ribosomal protein S14